MGWKSTTYVSRDFARRTIIENILKADDDTLESMLDDIADTGNVPGLYGYNFRVVEDDDAVRL